MRKKMFYCETCKYIEENLTEIDVVLENYWPFGTIKVTLLTKVRFCLICGTKVFDKELDNITLTNAYEEANSILRSHFMAGV